MPVIRYGTDTSGRAIYMTTYMRDWWERVVDELGFTPTIVQGAFMTRVGGGASASAGYHDAGGCLDLRTWNLGASQIEDVIRTTRSLGAASWVRDQRHGMDPHIHLLLGSDKPLASGAAYQWQQYLNGRDGLSGNGPDYHWRPSPLVTTPPREDYLMTSAAEQKLDKIIEILNTSNRNERERDAATAARDKRIAARLAKKLDRSTDEILAEFGAEG